MRRQKLHSEIIVDFNATPLLPFPDFDQLCTADLNRDSTNHLVYSAHYQHESEHYAFSYNGFPSVFFDESV